MTTLVVGATGILGSDICRRLRARNHQVRALVRRRSERASQLQTLGVELAEGDLRSRTTLAAACDGVAAVISTATVMGSKDKSLKLRDVDRDGQLQLVEIANSSGVERFVYTSVSPVLKPSAPLVRYKREVERAVRASRMRWTILQPSVFMDVWLSPMLGWDFAAGKATIFGSGRAPISWISVYDVAEYAVRSLDDARLANQDLPLGGPETLAPNDVLRMAEELSGRRFNVRRVPRALLLALKPVAALFNEAVASGMGLGAQAALGDVFDTPLQRELAVPLRTVREYIQQQVNRQ